MNNKQLKDLRAILRSIELNNAVLSNIQLNTERELFALENRRDNYEDRDSDYWLTKVSDLDERIDRLQVETEAMAEVSSSLQELIELMRYKFCEIEVNTTLGNAGEQLPISQLQRKSTDVFSDRDPLFDEIARLVVTSNTASTSSLQRRYSIGYNRAAKIMDQLEAAGIIGAAKEGKPRPVLVDALELERILEKMD